MSKRLGLLLLILSLLGGACDGDDPMDAGPPDAGAIDAGRDAGPTDAGTDSGPTDAGPTDAGTDSGPPDAGPPTPAAVASEVMAARTALDMALDDVPMEMRVDGAFTDIDLGAAGLDALIGEDGLETLAASDATVRALADLHTANVVIDRLEAAIRQLDDRAPLAALRTQTVALRDRARDYRDALSRMYRTRLEAGIVGSPVVVPSLVSNFPVFTNGTRSRLLLVLEGTSAADATADVSLECFPSDGAVAFTLDARAAETGASIASTSGSNTGTLSIPAAYDDVTAVELEFNAEPPSAMMFVEQCGLSVSSRRRLRAAAVAVPSDSAFTNAVADYVMAVDAFENQVMTLVGNAAPGLDMTVIGSATEATMLYRNLVAALVATDALPLPVEHYQRIARQIVHVRAMIDALLVSQPMSAPLYDELRLQMGEALTHVEAMIAATSTST